MKKNDVNGVLLTNKYQNISSAKFLSEIKKIFNPLKCGHTGTLDPLATGLLPICFGESNKFSHFLFESNKEYIVEAKFGIKTNSYDITGEIVEYSNVQVNLNDLLDILKKYKGEIKQTPPIFSALKVNGKCLYKYARENIKVEIKERLVNIFDIELINFNDNIATLKVKCSKGTYIRSLINDIGNDLNSGGTVISLQRTKVHDFSIENAFTINQLKIMQQSDLLNIILPIDSFMIKIPKVQISKTDSRKFLCGQSIIIDNIVPNDICRVYFENIFLGIANFYNDNNLFIKPTRLIANDYFLNKLGIVY